MLVIGGRDSRTVFVVGIPVETTVCVLMTVMEGSSELESPPSPPLPSMGTTDHEARATIDSVGVPLNCRNGKAKECR